MRASFTTTAFFLWAAPLVWGANFLLAYVLVAVACARGFAHTHLVGLPLVRSLCVVVSALACVAIAVLFRRAWQRARAASDRTERMLSFTAAGLAGLALVAVIFGTLPPLLLTTECR